MLLERLHMSVHLLTSPKGLTNLQSYQVCRMRMPHAKTTNFGTLSQFKKHSYTEFYFQDEKSNFPSISCEIWLIQKVLLKFQSPTAQRLHGTKHFLKKKRHTKLTSTQSSIIRILTRKCTRNETCSIKLERNLLETSNVR